MVNIIPVSIINNYRISSTIMSAMVTAMVTITVIMVYTYCNGRKS